MSDDVDDVEIEVIEHEHDDDPAERRCGIELGGS